MLLWFCIGHPGQINSGGGSQKSIITTKEKARAGIGRSDHSRLLATHYNNYDIMHFCLCQFN